MNFDLEDRKVVITGVSEGIGRALALAFSNAGAKVAGCARHSASMEKLSHTMTGHGHVFKQADLTIAEDAEAFFEEVITRFHGVDVLVNNVGSIIKMADFQSTTDEDWQESFQVNLMSAVRMSRLFIPALKNSNSPRIINISSITAAGNGELFPHYSAMKAGLSNFSVSLARTLAPHNILVNTVSPGPVWTHSWEVEAEKAAKNSGMGLAQLQNQIRSETGESTLLKRIGVPEDITGVVLFLASDHARWITATNFTVDGGILCDPF